MSSSDWKTATADIGPVCFMNTMNSMQILLSLKINQVRQFCRTMKPLCASQCIQRPLHMTALCGLMTQPKTDILFCVDCVPGAVLRFLYSL
jgi:hypothetical protein